eukprot:gene15182-biopygen3673
MALLKTFGMARTWRNEGGGWRCVLTAISTAIMAQSGFTTTMKSTTATGRRRYRRTTAAQQLQHEEKEQQQEQQQEQQEQEQQQEQQQQQQEQQQQQQQQVQQRGRCKSNRGGCQIQIAPTLPAAILAQSHRNACASRPSSDHTAIPAAAHGAISSQCWRNAGAIFPEIPAATHFFRKKLALSLRQHCGGIAPCPQPSETNAMLPLWRNLAAMLPRLWRTQRSCAPHTSERRAPNIARRWTTSRGPGARTPYGAMC